MPEWKVKRVKEMKSKLYCAVAMTLLLVVGAIPIGMRLSEEAKANTIGTSEVRSTCECVYCDCGR